MPVHRKVGGKLEANKLLMSQPEAKMIGSSVVVYQTPYRYVDRQITTELLRDSLKTPLIFSSFDKLIKLCFGGLDFKLQSIDGAEDDTKQVQIDKAMSEIKQIDKSLARIGKMRNCSTISCVRSAAMDGWAYRQAVFEKAREFRAGNLYVPRYQHLPASSFDKTPSTLAGNKDWAADEILKGIAFNNKEIETHFFQNTDSTKEPTEIDPEAILYIEDLAVPGNSSLLHSIISTVEFQKQARHDFRLALERVGVPTKVAAVDGDSLARMKTAGFSFDYTTIVDYANNLVQTQGINQAEVAIPGMKLSYPTIPVPISPMEVEKFIEQIILNHFFAKGITEQLAQAVSVSAAPGKALLDGIIAGYQEAWGRPFELAWQADFLDLNGYDLIISFDWWSWAPEDKKDTIARADTLFVNGGCLINDYRAAHGEDPYTPEQIAQLLAEQQALKRGGSIEPLPQSNPNPNPKSKPMPIPTQGA